MRVQDSDDRQRAPAPSAAPALPLAAFLSGRTEDEITDLLAYAFHVRERERRGPSPAVVDDDPVSRHRTEAAAELARCAFRMFHNRVEEIRQEAVREQLGRLRRPPGFLRLVAASALGCALAGIGGLWAMGQGALLAAMSSRAAAALGLSGIWER